MLALILFPVALAHALLIRADQWLMAQPTGRPVISVAEQPAVTVAELRTEARRRCIKEIEGQPIHLCRKADLLIALAH